MAARNAASVFSGATAEAPRCAVTVTSLPRFMLVTASVAWTTATTRKTASAPHTKRPGVGGAAATVRALRAPPRRWNNALTSSEFSVVPTNSTPSTVAA